MMFYALPLFKIKNSKILNYEQDIKRNKNRTKFVKIVCR